MKRIRIILLVGLFPLLSACMAGGFGSGVPEMTPLEIQSMQTRAWEVDQGIVFRSVVSVFQDLGYTIQTADINSGLITSESAASSNVAAALFTGTTRVEQTRATAFVEEIGSETRVRLNFVRTERRSMESGQTDRQDTPILNADTYQNAFERIDNAIFIRSAN